MHTVSKANSHLGVQILWELDSIGRTHAPVSVPAYTFYFVNTMADSVSLDGRRLSTFVSELPLYSLRNGILDRLLSDDARKLLAEHEQLAQEKENAIAEHQFELAARKRDAQYELLAQLNRLVPISFEILPKHILEVIRDLGFDGVLPNSD